MINQSAGLEVRHVPIGQILIGEDLPRDPVKVARYAELLAANPRQDLEPVMLELLPTHGLDLYRIRNGHHRFAAGIIAGRPDLLAVIITEQPQTQE